MPPDLNRGQFVGATIATAATLTLNGGSDGGAALAFADTSEAQSHALPPGALRVNGKVEQVPTDPRVSLVDLLRERLQLYGTKIGCNQGACGACTVLVDGQRVLACLALAVQYEGRSITTIEGFASGDTLHPLQQAFIERDGFQCGYCTAGQICSAVGMVGEVRRGVPSFVTADLRANIIPLTHDELRERMSGNLCRCGAHNGIVDAIAQYAQART